MKRIEEVMSEINKVFGLKENQDLTYAEQMEKIQTIIENDRSQAHASGYKQGQSALQKRIQNIWN